MFDSSNKFILSQTCNNIDLYFLINAGDNLVKLNIVIICVKLLESVNLQKKSKNRRGW